MDPDGDASGAGWTTSTDFPVTPGAAQLANGGGHDAFIAKPGPTGQRFLFATYLGGAGFESGAALVLDRSDGASWSDGPARRISWARRARRGPVPTNGRSMPLWRGSRSDSRR